ncbi:MAG: hypothetical protein Q4A01_00035 [Coriobacteriales bacterium]|nr:hypothetical protein [Coriobacteriales bacterium]
MANSTFDSPESYQDTDTYHEASPERRRQFNRYKKECDISDEHMFLLLYKQDLESVPENIRDNNDTLSKGMLVIGVLLLWNSLSIAQGGLKGAADVPLIFLSLGSFLLVGIVYFTGLLNPYKREMRQVNRRLKKMPDAPDFTEWDMEHPNREDRRASKKRK